MTREGKEEKHFFAIIPDEWLQWCCSVRLFHITIDYLLYAQLSSRDISICSMFSNVLTIVQQLELPLEYDKDKEDTFSTQQT